MWWGRTEDTVEVTKSEANSSQSTSTDLEEQFHQQQELVAQLKELVRQNEEKLVLKDKEIEENLNKASKLKIQYKAKVSQLNNQLHEAQQRISRNQLQLPEGTTKKSEDDDDDVSSEGSSGFHSEQSNRGRVLLLKKKMEENRIMFERREKEMQMNKQEMEKSVDTLRSQLEEREETISILKLQTSDVSKPQANDSINSQEIYAQVLYKDNKIIELNGHILQLEGKLMDLQENIQEKDQVIQTRNQAIQLLTEDLNRRGKAVVDQMDDMREEMRQMQSAFAEHETIWKEEKGSLMAELKSTKEKFTSEITEKDRRVSDLKETVNKLETARFDLSTRNAALQQKIVSHQDTLEKMKQKNKVASNAEVEALLKEISELKKALKEKESSINSLQQALDEVGTGKNDNNKSLVKVKAQYVSRIKILEKQLKQLQHSEKKSASTVELQLRESEEEIKGWKWNFDWDEYFEID